MPLRSTALIAGVIVSTAAAALTAKGRDPYAEKLDQAFEAYCRNNAAAPGCLVKVDNQVRKWKVLTKVCSPTSTDTWCKTIADIGPPLSLTFDPRRNRWAGVHGLDSARVSDDVLSFDVNNVPMVRVPGGRTVSVFIQPANPLLARVKRGDTKEEDIGQIKDLQRLFTLAGSTLAILPSDSQRPPPEIGGAGRSPDFFPTSSPGSGRAGPIEAAFNTEMKPLRDAVDVSTGYLDCLRTRLQRLERHHAALLALARALERGRQPAKAPPELAHDDDLENDKNWTSLFALLRTQQAQLDASLETVPAPLLGLYRDLIAISSADRDKVGLAASPLIQQNALDRCSSGSFRCLLNDDIAAIERTAVSGGDLTKRLEASRAAFGPFVTRLLGAHVVRAALLDKVAKVLEKADDVTNLALDLARVKDRARASDDGGGTIEPIVYVPDDEHRASWSKERTYPLTVKRQSPLKEVASENSEDVSTSYKIGHRQAALFGVGGGLTITPVGSPVWKAVADPANTAQKVIRQTDVESRSGQIALFVNYRLLQALWPASGRVWLRPGAEGGFALSSDKPAVYAGASFEFFGALRVGIGRGWFRVKELAGQQENQVVRDSDEITTRAAFHGGRYISVTLALGSLRLFGTDK
jgi:hypothetical protein